MLNGSQTVTAAIDITDLVSKKADDERPAKWFHRVPFFATSWHCRGCLEEFVGKWTNTSLIVGKNGKTKTQKYCKKCADNFLGLKVEAISFAGFEDEEEKVKPVGGWLSVIDDPEKSLACVLLSGGFTTSSIVAADNARELGPEVRSVFVQSLNHEERQSIVAIKTIPDIMGCRIENAIKRLKGTHFYLNTVRLNNEIIERREKSFDQFRLNIWVEGDCIEKVTIG